MDVCEQCGTTSKGLEFANVLRVFGKIFYFCDGECLKFWLKNHSRCFQAPR